MDRTAVRLLSGLLAAALSAGSAAPALATASTHIWAPSTDVQAYRTLHVTSDLYVPVERTATGDRVPTVTNLGLTAGVLPFRRIQLELGVDHKTGLGELDSYPLYFNGKIGIPEDAFLPFTPALAAGVFDLGTKTGRTEFNVFYVKAARTLGPVGRASFGYFSGRKALLRDGTGAEDNSGIMAAWERTMPEVSERLWLCAEYVGTESAYGTVSLGGSWRFTDAMSVLLGYDIFNESRQSPNTVTIQADIDLPFGTR